MLDIKENFPLPLDGTELIEPFGFAETVIKPVHALFDGYSNYSYLLVLDSSDNLIDVASYATNLELISSLNTVMYGATVTKHKEADTASAFVLVVGGNQDQLNVWKNSDLTISEYLEDAHYGFKNTNLLDVFYVDIDKQSYRSLMCDDISCCPVIGIKFADPTAEELSDGSEDDEEKKDEEPETPQLTEDQETIIKLHERIAQLKSQLEESQANHRRDIEIIKDELDSEAVYREWCDQYQEFLDKVNPNLVVSLGDFYKTYTVEVTVSREVSQTVEVEVEAKDLMEAEHEAFSLVRNDVEHYIDNDYWTVDDETIEVD